MQLLSTLTKIAEDCSQALTSAPVVGDVLRGTCRPEDYAMFVSQTYHYVKLTPPYLRRAAEALDRSGRYPALVQRYKEKAAEESGHDEWALRDVAALGLAAGEAALPAPTPAVSAYLAWNRFTIEAGSPIAFFGTAFVLEYLGATCAGPAIERLLARGAIPREAVLFLRGHAAADESHVAELLEALAQVNDPADQEAILLSARTTAALYPRLFVAEQQAG